MLTPRGIALVGSSVALYALARAVSIDELYPLAVAALVFPLAALAFVRLLPGRVAFARSLTPRRVFAGGSARITVTARNAGRLRNPPLLLEDPAPAALGAPMGFAVPQLEAGARIRRTIERRPPSRGRFRIGPMRARLVDPFGLAEMAADVAPPVSLTVYPRIEMLHESGPPETRGGTGRSVASRVAVAGDEFYAVRDWQEGDDLRKIHWRSTARRGELMIRQDEIHPFPRATILLDNRGRGHAAGGRGSSLEWAVSAAASLVWELCRQGFALRLATADLAPGAARWGREAADPLLSTLAVVGMASSRTITPVLRRLGGGPGAGGALIAILPPPVAGVVPPLARIARAYSWAGAVLLDTASFSSAPPRERASSDQHLADVERLLARAGWHVVVAGSTDRFKDRWEELLASGASRPSLRSRRS